VRNGLRSAVQFFAQRLRAFENGQNDPIDGFHGESRWAFFASPDLVAVTLPPACEAA
jgi:hypothetical protein